MTNMKLQFILVFTIIFLGGFANACTTFCFYNPNGLVYGKNYDWRLDVGLVVVNQQGLKKFGTSQVNTPRWTSSYGSVTFNQYGVEWPSGGMNTAGLVIELSWLNETVYASHENDDRDRLGTLSWIQYQLDTAATVDDIIESDGTVKISPGSGAKVHYLVCDASGACASIEFIDGKMQVHRQDTMPWSVLTNNSYEQSQLYAQAYLESGSGLNAKTGKRSLDRFVRTALAGEHLKQSTNVDAVDFAFETLDSVSQGDYTKWQIVYDIKTMSVYWRTLSSPELKILSFDNINFQCGSGTKLLDVNTQEKGAQSAAMVKFSTEGNLDLITKSYKGTEFLKNVPDNALQSMAIFHSHFKCS